MSISKQLAARFRQSVQGCTLHLHGPVQAWVTIEDACEQGQASREDVANEAIKSSTTRIESLLNDGVSGDDPRIKKEKLTRLFIQRLLLGT
jgi:hypothetical protein